MTRTYSKRKRLQTIDEALDRVERELILIRQGKPAPRLVVHRDGDHIWCEYVEVPWTPPHDEV